MSIAETAAELAFLDEEERREALEETGIYHYNYWEMMKMAIMFVIAIFFS